MYRFRAASRIAAFMTSMRCLTITPVPMPALSPTMEKGKITEWSKKVGDMVLNGDTFCKVETDKAVVGYDNAADEGYLARIIIEEGNETVVGQTVCLLVDEKEGINSPEVKQWKEEGSDAAPAASEPAPASSAPTPSSESSSTRAPASTAAGGRIVASPYARKLAAEKNISLEGVVGTGGGVGRIVSKDVLAAAAKGPGPKAATPAGAPAAATSKGAAKGSAPAPKAAAAANQHYDDIPVSTMRAVIAKRLHESKNIEIPHYYLFDTCCADNMVALIKQLNAKGNGEYKITVNDYIIKAVARANMLCPEVNASWQGSFIRQYKTVDVSVAVATPSGLITPIIRNAHAKGLVEISKEMKSLAKKARDNQLQPNEFQGGTVSVSNLGSTGIPGFTAIINPPQALILAIGSSKPRPEMVKQEDGKFEMTGKVETCIDFSASFDHRVVDGMIGAKWFQGFHDAIENPLSLLL